MSRPGPFTTFYEQRYHGGTMNPSGILMYRTANIAVSYKDWIGPPSTMNLGVLQ